jgi:uncharacterized protein YajQ (UPF0234 family)
VDAKYARIENEVTLTAEAEIQLDQMLDVLRAKMVGRKIDVKVLEVGDPKPSGKVINQHILVRQGINTDLARKIVKMIKDKRMKVQAAIQGDKVRVTGKKRDDLQQVMALIRDSDLDMPIQFDNFRD